MSKRFNFAKVNSVMKQHFTKVLTVSGVVLAGASVLAIYSSMHSEVFNGSRSPAAIGRARLPLICPAGYQKTTIQGRLFFDPGARSRFLSSFVRPTALSPISSFDFSLDYRVVQARFYTSVSGTVDPVVNSDGTFSTEICSKPSTLNLNLIPAGSRSAVAALAKRSVFEFRVRGKSHDSTLALNSCQSTGKPYINGQILAQCGSFEFSSAWQVAGSVSASVIIDKATKDLTSYQQCGNALLPQYAEVCQYGGANPAVLSLGDNADYDFGEIDVDANFKGLVKKSVGVGYSGLLKAKSMSMTIVPPGTPFSFTSGVYPGVTGTCAAETKAGCKIELQFVPQAPGSYNATLFLSYFNGISAQKTQVSLSGTRLDIPTCSDSVKNATESDVDCGGGACQKCQDTKGCVASSDCVSGLCTGGVCHTPSCTDGLFNGTESDVDCGGPACPSCKDSKFCKVSSDCSSNNCKDGQCSTPTCSDGVQNGFETGVDCGGICGPCASGSGCAKSADCSSVVCAFGKCADPTCNDGVKNGTESDKDCGGICPKCQNGYACASGLDCQDGMCQNGLCIKASCIDGIQNGGETGVDCGGGTCAPCMDGVGCSKGSDCSSNNCVQGKCATASCNDMLKNGFESDIDCGGPQCPPCQLGKTCAGNSDCYGPTQSCQGGVCANTCPSGQVLCGGTCTDLTTNYMNCGSCGAACPSIVNGQGACVAGSCQVKQCNSGFANCDWSPYNGCETNMYNDTKNCGACGLVCSAYANAVTACNNSVCAISNCAQGFANCNGMTNDGCEVNIYGDDNNCGACGNVCGMFKSCSFGVCK